MTFQLEIHCAMCGTTDEINVKDSVSLKTPFSEVLKPAKERGWIVQQNGENLDLYCSKRCAS